MIEENYLSLKPESLQESFASHMEFSQSKTRYTAQPIDYYKSAAYAIRDRLMEQWNDTNQTYYHKNVKKVYYLSLEFLMGRALGNTLINLGLYDKLTEAIGEFGIDLEEIIELEPDAGLGNGGLGRLAACFLDSMATLQLPGEGYGIRYDYGIFEQKIEDGCQVERPEHWLRNGYPWEIMRPEYQYLIKFNGNVSTHTDDQNHTTYEWENTENVLALPYDLPIPGYKNTTANTLRLWSARATQEFELSEFNMGDYIGAVEAKINSETISSVLYPKDDILQGKELRLKQEYMFVSASVQDIIRRYRVKNPDIRNLAEKVAIQLNDTHPALTIAELMRLLMDVEGLGWDEAWEICTGTCAYTNHTILPEALEQWSLSLFQRLLPRHLQIIYEINHRFLAMVKGRFPNDPGRLQRMSIIAEGPKKAVRMANLAIVGSHAVNGVSALHSELIKQKLFADFHALWPEKFQNKTNGITQRRWLKLANPLLSDLIEKNIGEAWVNDLFQLRQLSELTTDEAFLAQWKAVKLQNKKILAEYILQHNGVAVDPHSMFDIQVKRIHEYKRQILNVLHILTRYNRIKANPQQEFVPRTFIFGGKAAPGYYMAKNIIRLINAVANMVNNDPVVGDRLKVIFLANYNVSLAQRIFPAADLSEQISTAGLEASGTGNMKFALNGALTIGTLDGANIEIKEEVGDDNIFIFGLKTEEVAELNQHGYNSRDYYHSNDELKGVLDMISGGLGQLDSHVFQPIVQSLLEGNDHYKVLADYSAYISCQERVDEAYKESDHWAKMAIMNTACSGKFSSDRTIMEYAKEIWGVTPVKPLKRKDRPDES
ncbi:glycogen/starch/alpha-glucan phosphorylase [Myxococcota bacterium]|nr:glycogen/starch/alpha-glucan phosphorylase [Myxococcota bacterium]